MMFENHWSSIRFIDLQIIHDDHCLIRLGVWVSSRSLSIYKLVIQAPYRRAHHLHHRIMLHLASPKSFVTVKHHLNCISPQKTLGQHRMICTYMDNCLISYICNHYFEKKTQKATATDRSNSVVQRCLLAYLIPITRWVTLRLYSHILTLNPNEVVNLYTKKLSESLEFRPTKISVNKWWFWMQHLMLQKWFLFVFFLEGAKKGAGEASLPVSLVVWERKV